MRVSGKRNKKTRPTKRYNVIQVKKKKEKKRRKREANYIEDKLGTVPVKVVVLCFFSFSFIQLLEVQRKYQIKTQTSL